MVIDAKKEKYKKYTEDWKDRISNNYNGICVFISRKAPHLARVTGANIEGIISEHALPFVLPDYSGSDNTISIFDDSIHHGSTLERIKNVAAIGRAHFFNTEFDLNAIKVDTVVISDRAIVKTENKDIPIERDSFMFYFINRATFDFINLDKPYDVEFPILHFNVNDVTNIKEKIKKAFGDYEIYENTHLEDGESREKTNFSVLIETEGNDNDVSAPDFFKFRVYYDAKKNIIRIAAFAPHLIFRYFLNENSAIFRSTDFDPIWQEVVSKAKKIPSDSTTLDHSNPNYAYLCNEYNYHVEKSLNIWANYLLSFAKLLSIKDKIEDLIKECGGRSGKDECFEKNDLTLLIGEKLSSSIKGQLDGLYNTYDSTKKLPKNEAFFVGGGGVPDEVIPHSVAEKFYETNRRYMPKCKSVSELISILFDNIHNNVEIASRGFFLLLDRLRFGVSISSMRNDFSYYLREKEDELTINIHKNLDKRIDEGCIVPKYVRVESDGRLIWRRLYRAGENEDIFRGQLVRISALIFKTIQEQYKSDVILADTVENVFLYVLANISGKNELTNVGRIHYDINFQKSNYRLRFFTSNNSEDNLNDNKNAKFLIDYLKDLDILTFDKEQNSLYMDFKNNYQYSFSNQLCSSVENVIIEETRKITKHFCNNITKLDFREIINYHLLFRNDNYLGDLESEYNELFIKKNWIDKLTFSLANKIYLDEKSLHEEFRDLFLNIRDIIFRIPNQSTYNRIKDNIQDLFDEAKREKIEQTNSSILFERALGTYRLISICFNFLVYSYYTNELKDNKPLFGSDWYLPKEKMDRYDKIFDEHKSADFTTKCNLLVDFLHNIKQKE